MNTGEASFRYPRDLLTKKPIIFDLAKDELVGQKEVILKSTDDIIEIAQAVLEERASTASNRTHAIIELKMYRKKGNNVYVNHLKFIYLAGSEKIEGHFETPQIQKGLLTEEELKIGVETAMINKSLTVLGKVFANML